MRYDDYTSLLGDMGSYTRGLEKGGFKKNLRSWVSNPRPATTFANCVYTIKITDQFRRLGIPLIVICPRAALEPAHSKTCGSLPYKDWRPMS